MHLRIFLDAKTGSAGNKKNLPDPVEKFREKIGMLN